MPDQPDFQSAVALYCRQQGNNTVNGEVDMPNRRPGRAEHLAACQRNRLEAGQQTLICRMGQGGQQAVRNRYPVSRFLDCIRRSVCHRVIKPQQLLRTLALGNVLA